MQKFANLVAPVTSKAKDGAFASTYVGKVETKIFIPARFAKIALQVGDWLSLDGFTDPSNGQRTAMNFRKTDQPVYFGHADVKFFDLDKGFGFVTMQLDDGTADAYLSLDLVTEAGWIPSQGMQLEITAVKDVKRWKVLTFLLVEKAGEDVNDAGDGFIDLAAGDGSEEATKVA